MRDEPAGLGKYRNSLNPAGLAYCLIHLLRTFIRPVERVRVASERVDHS